MPILLANIAQETISPDFYNPDDGESFVRHSFWGLKLVFAAATLNDVRLYSHEKRNLLEDPSIFEISFTGSLPTSEAANLTAESRIPRAVNWEVAGLQTMPRNTAHNITRIDSYDTLGRLLVKHKAGPAAPVCKQEEKIIHLTANELVQQFFDAARGFLSKAGQRKLDAYLTKHSIVLLQEPLLH